MHSPNAYALNMSGCICSNLKKKYLYIVYTPILQHIKPGNQTYYLHGWACPWWQSRQSRCLPYYHKHRRPSLCSATALTIFSMFAGTENATVVGVNTTEFRAPNAVCIATYANTPCSCAGVAPGTAVVDCRRALRWGRQNLGWV